MDRLCSPQLYERGVLAAIASWILTETGKADRDLEDPQGSVPFPDEDREPRSPESHDSFKIMWPISVHLETTTTTTKQLFLVIIALRAEKETRCLIIEAGHCPCLGICPAHLLGPSYYSLTLFS